MNTLRQFFGAVAMAEAMASNVSGLLKKGGGHVKSSLTPKQWKKRKTRLKMQRDSRKINR